MTHERPVANYTAAVSAALSNGDIGAITGLLTLMALDGWGHEAEELRRKMVIAAEVGTEVSEKCQHPNVQRDPDMLAECPDCGAIVG